MSDLDRALRTMLRERAQDISHRPPEHRAVADDGTAEVVDLLPVAPAEHRRHTGVWLAAAAVAVLAAAGALALHGSAPAPHDHRAATVPTVTTTGCRVPATAAWTAAVAAATHRVPGASGLYVLGTDASGAAVVDYTPTSGAASRLGIGLVDSGSTRLRPVTSLSAAEGLAVGTVDGNDLLLLNYHVRHSHDRHGNRVTETEGVRSYRLLDLTDGHIATVVAHRAGLADNAVLRDGHVYYQTDGGVFDYDVAGGSTTRVSEGHSAELQGGAAGVWWHDNGPIDRLARVPAVIAAQLSGSDVASRPGHGVDRISFVTDGKAWAWSTPTGAVEWWSPGAKHVVRVPGLLGAPYTTSHGRDSGYVLAVAGRFVYLQLPAARGQHAADVLLDTRSGTATPVQLNLVAGRGGTFVGEPPLPVVLRDPVPTYGTLTELDTAGLPELHC